MKTAEFTDIRLTVLDESQINYELLNVDSVCYSRILKGKIVKGEFEFNRRIRFLPAIVATVYSDSKVRLGILANGNLIIDGKWPSDRIAAI